MKHLILLFVTVLLLSIAASSFSDETHSHEENPISDHKQQNSDHGTEHHNHEKEHHDRETEHSDHKTEHTEHSTDALVSHIDRDLAEQVGIKTSTAAPAKLEQSIELYGTLISGPEQLSHVRARFEGIIKSVSTTIGDQVEVGDLLAQVESNDSLRTYQMRAPISGIVVQRHANIGEFTQDQVLFSIKNLDTLWAELRVFPSQQRLIKTGQRVSIVDQGNRTQTAIDHVIPSQSSPYQLARIKLDNSDRRFAPGLVVQGQVVIDQSEVALAVANQAVQEIDGQQGVFLKQGQEYVFTPLIFGAQDKHFIEVREGLQEGDEYVSTNSYLLKADIEKSEVGHGHSH